MIEEFQAGEHRLFSSRLIQLLAGFEAQLEL